MRYITYAQRARVVSFKEENPSVPAKGIACWAQREFKLAKPPPKATITWILRRAGEYALETANPSRKTARQAKLPMLERALATWINSRANSNVYVSIRLIKEKARSLSESDERASGFKFSFAMLYGFFKRFNLRLYILHGESGDADTKGNFFKQMHLKMVTRSYDLRDVFNADETALMYKKVPTKTVAPGRMEGRKTRKERLSVLFCANADGSDQRKPLLIGTAKRPRPFDRLTPREADGFDYFNNKKAWMTRDISTAWLTGFNADMKRQGRHVLLLLDNVSNHKKLPAFSNVTLEYMPPRTTSKLQPLDAGIIADFKISYDNLHAQQAVHLDEMGLCDAYAVDQRQAMRWTEAMWAAVKPGVVANCWKHVHIVEKDDDHISSGRLLDNKEVAPELIQSLVLLSI